MKVTGFDKIAQKAQRLSEKETAMKKAMKTRGKNLLPGDVLIVPLQNAPEEVDAFWVVLAENEEEKDFVLIVPADTYDLVGSTDMKIPDYSYMSGLVLRLGQPQWYKKDLFSEKEGTRKVGFIDDFFVERARSVVARLIRLAWEGNPLQKKVDNEEEYHRWVEKIHLCSILLYQRYEELMAEEYARETVPAADSHPQHAVPELHAPDLWQGLPKIVEDFIVKVKQWGRDILEPIRMPVPAGAGSADTIPSEIPVVFDGIREVSLKIWESGSNELTISIEGENAAECLARKPKITLHYVNGDTVSETFFFNSVQIKMSSSRLKYIDIDFDPS